MMNDKPKFRILNKTNKNVTIKMGDGPHTMSWDEYNQTFVTEDKFWAVFNEETQKKHDQVEDAISWATVYFLSMRAADGNPEKSRDFLTNSLAFGQKMEEIQKLLECSLIEATQLVRKRLMLMNPFMVNPMFSDDQLKKEGMYRKNKYTKAETDNKGNRKVATIEQGNTGKPTLGDAFSCLGELKEKMENK